VLYARICDACGPVGPLHILHLAWVIGLRDSALGTASRLHVFARVKVLLVEVTRMRSAPIPNRTLLKHSLLIIPKQIPVMVTQVCLA